MLDLLLYFALAAVGFVLGSKLRRKEYRMGWTGKVQTAAIFILIICMGTRMGASEEVFRNLGTIGISALIFTVIVQIFSVASVSVTRRLLHFDRFGNPQGKTTEKKAEEPSADGSPTGMNKMTVIIFFAAAMGICLGHFVIAAGIADGSIFGGDPDVFSAFAGNVIRAGLCILLFFVGFDMSSDSSVFENMKKAGLKVLLFPVSGCIGALIGAVISGMILRLSMKEALAIGAGFSWYTLAPGLIMDAGFVNASAISFLHNVGRELTAILFVPMAARRVGYIESTALPGAAAMDVCLPIVERSTNSSVAIYSFLSGAVSSFLVPILVPLILAI